MVNTSTRLPGMLMLIPPVAVTLPLPKLMNASAVPTLIVRSVSPPKVGNATRADVLLTNKLNDEPGVKGLSAAMASLSALVGAY